MSSVEMRRHRQAKRIKITVRADGSVLVTRPWWVAEHAARLFVEKNQDWIQAQQRKLQRVSQYTQPDLARFDRSHYLQHKRAAREFIVDRVTHWNQWYGFSYRRIAVRNQRTRWGSCSSQKNLNFSYKLLFLPNELADYVIVHELCHLQELNHSALFWRLVAQSLPDYKQRRRRLRSLL